jgi:hypothetical protein
LHAQIYSLLKTRISMDLYVTDSGGIVQFDSGHPENVGRNFRAFRDVSMTLQGHYGARATLQGADPKGMILYVAAPIFVKGQVWGVATAYKPQRDVEEFLADTERTLTFVGLSVVIVCTLIGAVFPAGSQRRWLNLPPMLSPSLRVTDLRRYGCRDGICACWESHWSGCETPWRDESMSRHAPKRLPSRRWAIARFASFC